MKDFVNVIKGGSSTSFVCIIKGGGNLKNLGTPDIGFVGFCKIFYISSNNLQNCTCIALNYY